MSTRTHRGSDTLKIPDTPHSPRSLIYKENRITTLTHACRGSQTPDEYRTHVLISSVGIHRGSPSPRPRSQPASSSRPPPPGRHPGWVDGSPGADGAPMLG